MSNQSRILDSMVAKGLVGSQAKLEQCGGGDTHQSFVVRDQGENLFVKANHKDFADVLASEFSSLSVLEELVANFYPRPRLLETASSPCYLIMQFHAMAPITPHNAASVGQLLAEQHRIKANQFGWHQSNHIGLTEQSNQQASDWGDFFWRQRLQPQIELARKNGLPAPIIHGIMNLQPTILDQLTNLDIQPCLLHGDFWRGNAAYDEDNKRPILYDPAPYFGDPVSDLAMTHLFGSFPLEFYAGYHDIHPVKPNQDWLESVYNLYHALNHFNLFGPGYCGLINKLVNNAQER